MNQLFSGLKSWYYQRTSSVFLLFALPYIMINILQTNWQLSNWLNWVQNDFNRIILFITTLLLNLHAWIGFRNIILDYVHNTNLKLFILNMVILILLVLTLWVAVLLFITLG